MKKVFLFWQLYKVKVVDIEVINLTFTGHLERFVDLEESSDENI